MISVVYLLLLFAILYFSYKEFIKQQRLPKKYMLGMAIILIFVAGFRSNVGADYLPYVNLYRYFNQIPGISYKLIFEGPVEPFYAIVSKILGYFKLPFYWLTFVFALIAIGAKTYSFYNYSYFPFLALGLYFVPLYFIEDMGQIRQGAAMGLCLFSFKYIYNRNIIKYVLIVLLAYFIHKTSFIFLPAYFLVRVRISTQWALGLIVLSIVLWPFEIFQYMGSFVDYVGTEDISENFKGYVDSERYGQDYGFRLQTDFVRFMWILIIFSFDKSNYNKSKIYSYARNLTLVFFCLFYMFRGNTIFATRAIKSYEYFLWLTLSLVPFLINSKWKNYIYYYYIFYLIVMMVYLSVAHSEKLNFDHFYNVFINPYQW